ncbi:MAG: FAD-binding oxidoreductase [Pseudomonadota bacterium]
MTNPADPAFEARLRAVLPDVAFPAVDPSYFEEPRGRWHPAPGLVVAPGNAEETSALVRLAAEAQVALVPRGGGTGLVGGQTGVDVPHPVLVSLERMRRIRSVSAEEDVIVAEAGATLSEVQTAAELAGRLFPLSYGSEGTATIGGALAVNSGGLNVLRYGTARALCLGLEAVLPDGQIWNGLVRLRKDNTGYDLRDLLIGAEGTLGLITAASLRLYPRPASRSTALLAVPSPADALRLLARTREIAGEAVSAFELISAQGPAFVAETGILADQGLDPFPDWAVLMEIAPAGAGGSPQEMVEAVFDAGIATDGVIAQSDAQRAALWRLREAIPEANRKVGAIASHDIALPLSQIADFIARAPARIASVADVRINAFGHLGDGNLHYNAFPAVGRAASEYRDQRAAISHAVHDLVAELGGSFSAEHGVGRLKTGDLERYGDPAKLAAMRAIKSALDSNGIMNPGAVLRAGTGT